MKVQSICPFCDHVCVYNNETKEPVNKSCSHLAFVKYGDEYGVLTEICYEALCSKVKKVTEINSSPFTQSEV